MIELSGIDFRYPKSDFRLRIEHLKLEKESRTAIIGPSGFGKTTLLNLLAGILVPDDGEVRVGETRVNGLSEKLRRDFRIRNVGFVFQDFRLISYLNISDNILLPFRINRALTIRDDSMATMKSLAGDLGIGDKLRKYPAKLSHGERQRVAICRALMNQPALILADEPTGNLDPVNKLKIMEILFSYVGKFGSTLVTVTHDHAMLKGFDTTIDFSSFQQS